MIALLIGVNEPTTCSVACVTEDCTANHDPVLDWDNQSNQHKEIGSKGRACAHCSSDADTKNGVLQNSYVQVHMLRPHVSAFNADHDVSMTVFVEISRNFHFFFRFFLIPICHTILFSWNFTFLEHNFELFNLFQRFCFQNGFFDGEFFFIRRT